MSATNFPTWRVWHGVIVLSALCCGTSSSAQSARPSLQDSFRLGNGGGTLCQVQVKSHDAALNTIFDRAWSIVCRDAAKPIGKLYALRDPGVAFAKLDAARAADAQCQTAALTTLSELGAVSVAECQLRAARIGYHVTTVQLGKVTYVVEGLAAYDSALQLALRTIIADQHLAGKITVATSGSDDPTAFARVQAGTLDLDQALAEGYRRNNSGNYAEAAAFFDTLQARALESGVPVNATQSSEYQINRALQLSNLGSFAEADSLFTQAESQPTVDRVQTRLRRNFQVIHLINQGKYEEAAKRLAQPVVENPRDSVQSPNAIEIGAAVAAEINAGTPVGQRLGATESSALTPQERADFLDAQALQLQATLMRLQGHPREASPLFERAYSNVLRVREGRVLSVIRLRAQILAEAGLALEDSGNSGGGEAKMREALALLETRYPQTVSVNGARARLAAYLARHGQDSAAMTLYQQVIATAVANHEPTTGLSHLLSPYFDLLVKRSVAQPDAIDELFLAAQTQLRPGVADTQATLGRELSAGNQDAARLFRQAQTLDRDIELSRIELANIAAIVKPSPDQQRAAAMLRTDLAELMAQQTVTQAQLGNYPQFRAIALNVIPAKDIRALLKPDEAYVKMTVVGEQAYAVLLTQTASATWRVALDDAALADQVSALRDTISVQENGQQQTYPFDLDRAHRLYIALFGPVAEKLQAAHHILFEPDGALLKLPINLLVTDQASVDAYAARTADPAADQFNFTGVAWLGRGRAISTMVSAGGFRDARNGPPSHAAKQYMGFGQNAPLTPALRAALPPRAACDWPLTVWAHPIAATEINAAQRAIGGGTDSLTGAAFTDSAVVGMSQLDQYRILHFATHGLVTPPGPQCHANPALLTSFAGTGSDGLLSFKEIYGLKLDADVVILSACDTASAAGLTATREAGLTSGGTNALDGLVRAFIGAGSRTILATHWPAPEDFHATEKLIDGTFHSPAGTSIGDALLAAQTRLMDDPLTSHPYYWSGFAVVGDGTKPLLPAR